MEITNTTSKAKSDPMSFLAEAMSLGTGRAIENSEARGQTELVNSECLPTDNRDRKVMEKWGIEFGDPLDGDPMFCKAILPKGWYKDRTDNSMWSKLVDDKGRERAAMFYKAAHYDRSAHISATRRFVVQKDYENSDGVEYQVLCEGKPLYAKNIRYDGEKYGESYRTAENLCESNCKQWLDEKYPGHDDLVNSWDIEIS